MATTTVMPVKQREMHNHHMDSTIWNEVKFRPDDIIIATCGKSGTTWMQQIVGQLVLGPDPDLKAPELSPWMDLRALPKEVKLAQIEAQTHRRFLKTHLPVDALVVSPEAKYIYVARDGRDMVWSAYNHHKNGNAMWYSMINDTPGLVGPPLDPPGGDVHEYYLHFINNNGHPWWPFWHHIRSWWDIRDLPNVKLVHFANLKADLEGGIKEIAEFLGISKDDSEMERIVEYCTFDWMKSHAQITAPLGGAFLDGGGETFINKGTNGRWMSVLTEEEKAEYDAMAVRELGEACAHWLSTGEYLKE